MIAAGTAPPNFRGNHNLHISISNKTRAASDRNMDQTQFYSISIWLHDHHDTDADDDDHERTRHNGGGDDDEAAAARPSVSACNFA